MIGRPQVVRYFTFLIGVLALIGAALIGFTLYERMALGAIRLGTGDPPQFTRYYFARLAVIALLSLLLVGGLYLLRDDASVLHKRGLSASRRLAVYGMLAIAGAGAALFAADRSLFYAIAQEDGPVEWASALLPLASSAAFLYAFCRILRTEGNARRNVALVLTALFSLTLFVVGMEEISWMQRVFGLETPSLLSDNQQNEINLHNMYSSMAFNLAYRTMVFGGLIVLPFLSATAPRNALFEWIKDFLPNRFVLAMSAPLAGFDFNGWNFFLGPLLLALTLVILGCYAVAAWQRGDREETVLFSLVAAAVAVIQAVFLAAPASFTVHAWTISEYRELLLAAGLAVFTWEVTGRLTARYDSARDPYRALPA